MCAVMWLAGMPIARLVLRGSACAENAKRCSPLFGRAAVVVLCLVCAGVVGSLVSQNVCLAEAAVPTAPNPLPKTHASPGTQLAPGTQSALRPQSVPPRVKQARRFLAERGIIAGRAGRRSGGRLGLKANLARPMAVSGASSVPTWTGVGPLAVETASYGLVSGRVSAMALDPSDAGGNTLYVGTTGGGVWKATNAAAPASGAVSFTPLTDGLEALSSVQDASLSIGALTVQPQRCV